MKSGNDVNQEVVKGELKRFDYYDVYNYQRYEEGEHRYFENFRQGIVTISNAKESQSMRILNYYIFQKNSLFIIF